MNAIGKIKLVLKEAVIKPQDDFLAMFDVAKDNRFVLESEPTLENPVAVFLKDDIVLEIAVSADGAIMPNSVYYKISGNGRQIEGYNSDTLALDIKDIMKSNISEHKCGPQCNHKLHIEEKSDHVVYFHEDYADHRLMCGESEFIHVYKGKPTGSAPVKNLLEFVENHLSEGNAFTNLYSDWGFLIKGQKHAKKYETDFSSEAKTHKFVTSKQAVRYALPKTERTLNLVGPKIGYRNNAQAITSLVTPDIETFVADVIDAKEMTFTDSKAFNRWLSTLR